MGLENRMIWPHPSDHLHRNLRTDLWMDLSTLFTISDSVVLMSSFHLAFDFVTSLLDRLDRKILRVNAPI